MRCLYCFKSANLCSVLLFALAILLPTLLFAQMATRSVPMPATGADEESRAGGVVSPTDEASTARLKKEDAKVEGTFDGIGNPNAPRAKKDNRIVKPNTLGRRYDPGKDRRIMSGMKMGGTINYSERRSGSDSLDYHKSAGDFHKMDFEYHRSGNRSTIPAVEDNQGDWKKRN